MVELIAGAAALGAGGLFSYNRDNFLFDKDLQLKRDYQSQEMMIRQFELYREDVRDLVALTIRKMDNYLVVNTLQLGFCITLFVEGRPKDRNTSAYDNDATYPLWLLCLYSVCNVGAFMYYLLSMWLAMHASVAAHSFGVRLLTQFVRLPVPNEAQLDNARKRAHEFEELGVTDIMRIPLWKQQLQRLNSAMSNMFEDTQASDTASEISAEPAPITTVAMLQHVKLYQQVQANWQSYDAYSRVCMALGTNQLLHTLSYIVLGQLISKNNAQYSAFCCVLIFATCAWILVKLDLYLSRRFLAVAGVFLVSPPTLAAIALFIKKMDSQPGASGYCVQPSNNSATAPAAGSVECCKAETVIVKGMVPLIYGLHLIWIVFTLLIARADEVNIVALPTKFRSVLYLDVFGWLTQEDNNDPSNSGRSASNLEPLMEEDEEEAPEDLYKLKAKECLDIEDQITNDLNAWEGRKAQLQLAEDQATKDQIRKLRERLQLLKQEAQSVDYLRQLRVQEEDLEALEEDGSPSRKAPEVWLQMEWNMTGSPMNFWFQPETEKTVWELPQGPGARVSRLDEMQEDMEKLLEQVKQVRTWVESLSPPEPSAPEPGTRAARESNATNGTRDEAPELRVAPGTEAAEGSFHPGAAPPQDQQVNRRPGRLPWYTVCQGSVVLFFVWLVVGGWAVLHVSFCVALNFEAARSTPAPGQPKRPTQLFAAELPLHSALSSSAAAQWPTRFLRPVGLACHASLSGFGLLAERYGVYVIDLPHLDEASGRRLRREELQESLNSCLTAKPGFRGQGLSGITLDCAESNAKLGCHALLLSATGRAALRCPLQGGLPDNITLHGGPWSALAAEPSTGHLWALQRHGLAVVQLRPRDKVSELMPHADLQDTQDLALGGALVVLENATGPGSLLSLSSEGSLAAWPLTGGSPQRWMLRPEQGLQWAGLCANAGSLFLLGASNSTATGSRSFGLWRTDRPAVL